MFLRNAIFVLLAACAAGAIGCGGGEAPRYPVQGVVTLNGDPYPNALIQYVPDPGNAALAEAEDVTGPNGNYKLTNLGRSGLPVGKYRVIVKPKQSAEEAAADAAKYEDEEQRRVAMEAMAGGPSAKKAKKAEKPSDEFVGEVIAGDNILDYDVKAKTAK